MRSECVSSRVMRAVNWLAGKHDNRMDCIQKVIDRLNKTLELVEQQKEKDSLETSAMYFETAKQQYHRDNNIRGALFYMNLKRMMDEAVQDRRRLCLPLHQQLMFVENIKKALLLTRARRTKKKKKLIVSLPMPPVFVFLCFFLLILAYSLR